MAIEYLVIYDQSLPSNTEAQVKSICSPVPSVSVSRRTLEAIPYLFDNAYQTGSSVYWTSNHDDLHLLIYCDILPVYIGQLDITHLSVFDRMDKAYARMEMLWSEAYNLDDELDKHLKDVAQNYAVINSNLPAANPYCLGNDFYESMDIMKETIEEIFDSYRIYGRELRDD